MLRSDVSPNPVRSSHDDLGRSSHDDPARPDDLVRLLTPDGERVRDPEYEPWVGDVDDERLTALYEDMVVVRRLDQEATALQRQGELGLWPPLQGQEAAQIGSARALRSDDFVFSSYREHAVAWVRGVTAPDLLRMWRGTAASGWNPFSVGMATPAIIIGAQTLHATGYAMGCAKDGSDAVTLAYFGDGATSQGDANEALVFAASYRAPVVFFCQNNQWAISEPVGLQAVRPIADRAPGFGIPSVRVDGNDVLAVTAVTRAALDRARRGDGPTYVEAVTYRQGPHTTADDPTRYVDPERHAEWLCLDPLSRVAAYLERAGTLDAERRAAVEARADAVAAELRAACHSLEEPEALELFDHVTVERTPWLERQRDEYVAYLAMFEGADGSGGSDGGETR